MRERKEEIEGREEQKGYRQEDGACREECDDERGFDYTTTANIAEHFRSDTRGGNLILSYRVTYRI